MFNFISLFIAKYNVFIDYTIHIFYYSISQGCILRAGRKAGIKEEQRMDDETAVPADGVTLPRLFVRQDLHLGFMTLPEKAGRNI